MINTNRLNEILTQSKGKKICVIGDVMLDRYLLGDVTRISPEAPVQVFDIKNSEHKFGGAANVSLNIKELGSEPVLIGVIGNDNEGKIIIEQMKNSGKTTIGIIEEDNRPTTTKTRVIADSHHLLRIDSESKQNISEETESQILNILKNDYYEIEAIILQDYNKGVLTKSLINNVIKFANDNNIKVLVDPKFYNFFEFKNIFLFKPNRKELEEALGKKAKNENELLEFAEELFDKINCKYLVLTLGDKGVMLFEKTNGEIKTEKIPTFARKVADVSGAGDTVISTIAVCLAGGASVSEAVKIANFAAGIVVEEVGIVPITKEKLEAGLK
ncbi:MAG TPA: D-glycero-beta-D-manno-heptose-7-phosphate kinase [Ignavibacteria bacterium]|nr:D-glycero-beta-D-manno-heptose-7-phosphate kinase [Ignavibacteria bacterium]